MKKTSSNKAERLNKILAVAGIASRRRADELISQGLVTVNGRKETRLGSQAVWGIDAIAVNGQPIPAPPKKIYLILNKPFGYVCTLRDPEGRPTVRDLVKGVKERIFPVGRLDFDSQGNLQRGETLGGRHRLDFNSRLDRLQQILAEGLKIAGTHKNMLNAGFSERYQLLGVDGRTGPEV